MKTFDVLTSLLSWGYVTKCQSQSPVLCLQMALSLQNEEQGKYFLTDMKGRVKQLLFRNQADKHFTLFEAPEISKLITCK